MKFKYLIWIILLFSCQVKETNEEIGNEISEAKTENKLFCTARVSVSDYMPIEFQDESRIPKQVSNKLKKEFQSRLGEQLADKIIFTFGVEYDLEEINQNHFENVKNYEWEIPRYYLNYALIEPDIKFCMSFEISKKNEILRRNVPFLFKNLRNQKFLTKKEAIKKIRNKLDNEELKMIKFEYSDFIFNWNTLIFEWEFGGYEKVWIEAYEKGNIRQGKFQGLINLF